MGQEGQPLALPASLRATVGADGRLTLDLGAGLAGQAVEVTLRQPVPAMTQEEWRAFVLATAGSIPDPTFIRHEQGEHQERDPL